MTPVRVRGVTYPSAASAARALGLHVNTVHKHLDAGTPDLIGMGVLSPSRPCVINGVSYPSLRAAGRALGVSATAITKRVKRAAQRGGAV